MGGIVFSYYLHYFNYCNYWNCFSFFTQIFLLPSSGQGHLSFPGQAFRHAVMASHWRSQPGRTAECRSRSVSHVLCTRCLACAWLCFVFNIFRLSSKGAISKQMFVINKNIVHLVDDIIWNSGFKTESQGEQVLLSLFQVLQLLLLLCLLWLLAASLWSGYSWPRLDGQARCNR